MWISIVRRKLSAYGNERHRLVHLHAGGFILLVDLLVYGTGQLGVFREQLDGDFGFFYVVIALERRWASFGGELRGGAKGRLLQALYRHFIEVFMYRFERMCSMFACACPLVHFVLVYRLYA